MRYAIVAVHMTQPQRSGLLSQRTADGARPPDVAQSLARGYHYLIPEHLADEIALGQLVWVNFGRERRQGLIVGFDDSAPVASVRPLLSLTDPTPLLRPFHLQLASWISSYYLAPLWDTLLLMLPPGILQSTERIIRLSPTYRNQGVTQPLARDQRTLLAWLDAQGPEAHSTLSSLAKLFSSERKATHVVESLTTLDLIREEIIDKRPGISPRRECFVSLIADPARIRARFGHLGRQSKAADLLAWLAQQPGGRATRAAALEAVAAKTATPITTLEKHGWVTREDGHIQLLLDPRRVPPTLLAMRGSETFLTVLEFLARNPTEMTISEVYAATGADLHHLRLLASEGLILIDEREISRNPLAGRTFPSDTPPPLTPEQTSVWAEIEADLRRRTATPGSVFLLHGVTGSGKTEVYLQAVAEVLRQGKQAIVLVPEIALTPQTVARFGARFGAAIALQHSQLTPGERFDEWRRLRDGDAQIAIGSRSAIFAPLERPGLIVIDEEHEWTYKQEDLPAYHFPHYHARDVAAQMARITGATVVLGSATPSIESYTRALRGEYRLVEMTGRVALHRRAQPATLAPLLQHRGVLAAPLLTESPAPALLTLPAPDSPEEHEEGGLPPVQIVDLRQELRAGNTSIFSRALREAIAQTLAAGQQAVLFLNRRGASTFVMCRDCGWVTACEDCDLPMTYHQGVAYLLCHQCNNMAPIPTSCYRCLSLRVKHFGVGTQQVESKAHELFPTARIMRWDKDTAHEKGSHERLLTRFAAGQADLLIGTQMIAKGLDLPMVTLVGVITADTGIQLPDFRAAERTFQLLTQVAGRAGRSIYRGRVILQTYTPLHYAILTAARHDYHDFYRREIRFRREHAYPPIAPLIKLVYSHDNAQAAQKAAEDLADTLRTRLAQLGLPATDIIGPAPAFFGKLRKRYRWQLLIRGAHAQALLHTIAPPLGWIIDVDPASVL